MKLYELFEFISNAEYLTWKIIKGECVLARYDGKDSIDTRYNGHTVHDIKIINNTVYAYID